MKATFDSVCPACETDIIEGQVIVKGLDGWQHRACPTDPIGKPVLVCPSCGYAKAANGTCGCEEAS